MTTLSKDRRGIAQIALVLIVVAVLGVVGFAGWKVMQKNNDKDAAGSSAATSVADKAAQAVAKAECQKNNDKDLCKFMTSWKLSKQYRMTSTDPGGSKSVFEVDGDNKSHISVTGGEYPYDIITIDKTTYTKAGDIWYKQTSKPQPDQDVTPDVKTDFKDPEEEASKPPEDKTTYKALGKEPCGSLKCFKYEISDPEQSDSKQFIWFDDKDYQLRKSRSESKDGVSEQTYEYGKVSINVPSPVKELGPNQYVMPGSSEVMTVPSAQDFGQ